jgi:hypothetical protein
VEATKQKKREERRKKPKPENMKACHSTSTALFGFKKETIWGRNVNLLSDYTYVVTLQSVRQPHL